MLKKFGICFFVVTLLIASTVSPVRAQSGLMSDDIGPGYAEPNYRDLAQTLMAFRAHEMAENNGFVDEYARILYCRLVRQSYQNDFEWARVRNSLKDSVNDDKDRYRRFYEFVGTLRLDRYDFESQTFPVNEETRLEQVGAMIFFQTAKLKLCAAKSNVFKFFPLSYVLQLQSPVTLNEVPIAMDDAEQLIRRFGKDKNKERLVYVRFRIRIDGYAGSELEKAILFGDIVNMDIFLDKEMTLYVTHIPR